MGDNTAKPSAGVGQEWIEISGIVHSSGMGEQNTNQTDQYGE
jgi:hypothetical protein